MLVRRLLASFFAMGLVGRDRVVSFAPLRSRASILRRMRTNKTRPRLRRLKRVALAALVIFGVTLGLWLFSLRASPLPSPPALDVSMPAASPPSSMAVFQIPTGVTHRSAAFAYRGGSLGDTREFSMTAVLVRHPAGDLLIDTGFGRDIDAHFQMMPFAFRAVTSYAHHRSAADQLEAAFNEELEKYSGEAESSGG